MTVTPEGRAGLISVMRLVGIPVSIETERAGPLPVAAPLSPEMSKLVADVAIGMPEEGRPTPSEIKGQVEFIHHHARAPLQLAADGHTGLAVDRAAAVFQVLERLAEYGSEAAAAALLQHADLYRDAGLLADAVDLARRRLNPEHL